MKSIYIAQMCWCEREVPVCAGTNKRKVERTALGLLKSIYGTGPVDRGAAMCSEPISYDDIEIVKVPFVTDKA